MRCKLFWEYWERERVEICIVYILIFFFFSKVKSRESWKLYDEGGIGKVFGI